MKQLQQHFTGRGEVGGFEFTQVARSSLVYVYRVQHNGSTWYEVFRHKENTQFDCVSYPSSKAFGVWAWTFETEAEAEKRFEELNLPQASDVKKP